MTSARATSLDPGDFTLLVVDDVEDNRELLSRRFRKRGFAVVCAEDGPAALATLKQQPIDLIILDVNMPGMSGLEVLTSVRSEARLAEIPVIMATARSDSEHVVEALDLGADDYVTKPIDFPVLHARVVTALRGKAPSASQDPTAVGPGIVVAGRYRLESKIGEGGFGAVYRAVHIELEQPVAVKVLHATHAAGELLDRFRREGMHACRVQHPNALAVMDSGVTGGVAFLVMELLEGHTLEDEMKNGPMRYVRCAEVLAPVCEALSAAHEVGIVHRDIKPANIYLHHGPHGETPKVLDFGIAKIIGEAAAHHMMTLEGSLVGTPAFMAPERFLNQEYDGKSDVYAIGVMLNLMITGALPFASETVNVEPMALAMMHTQEPPLPLSVKVPDAPAGIEALILRALSKDPKDRPSAAELAQKLVGAVDGVDRRAVASFARDPALDAFATEPQIEATTHVSMSSTMSLKKPKLGTDKTHKD